MRQRTRQETATVGRQPPNQTSSDANRKLLETFRYLQLLWSKHRGRQSTATEQDKQRHETADRSTCCRGDSGRGGPPLPHLGDDGQPGAQHTHGQRRNVDAVDPDAPGVGVHPEHRAEEGGLARTRPAHNPHLRHDREQKRRKGRARFPNEQRRFPRAAVVFPS